MIHSEVLAGVRVVRLDHGENRLGSRLLAALHGELDEAEAKGAPLVLTGSGKYFSNGLDLAALAADGPSVLYEIHRLLARLLRFPGATAAAINGHAFGAGAIVAAACDYRFMRQDRGYFCFPEVDLGLAMSREFDAVLRAKYPTSALLHALVSGKKYTASDAQAAGFVDEIASEAELVQKALQRLAELVQKDGQTVRALKNRLFAPALGVLEGA